MRDREIKRDNNGLILEPTSAGWHDKFPSLYKSINRERSG